MSRVGKLSPGSRHRRNARGAQCREGGSEAHAEAFHAGPARMGPAAAAAAPELELRPAGAGQAGGSPGVASRDGRPNVGRGGVLRGGGGGQDADPSPSGRAGRCPLLPLPLLGLRGRTAAGDGRQDGSFGGGGVRGSRSRGWGTAAGEPGLWGRGRGEPLAGGAQARRPPRPPSAVLHRNGGSVRCYQMALGAAEPGMT